MNKYIRLKKELETAGTGSMKCFGSSMLPIITSGATCSFSTEKEYIKGDIVFCKVRGRYIDAHLITKVGPNGTYMISNNKGHDNGWTKIIYGRVIRAIGKHNKVDYASKVRTLKEE